MGPSQGAPQGGMLPEPTVGLWASYIGPTERLRAADPWLAVLSVSVVAHLLRSYPL